MNITKIEERANNNGCDLQIHIDIAPPKEYENYSVKFMGAINKPKIYLMNVIGILDKGRRRTIQQEGEIIDVLAEELYPFEISIDNCLRLDAVKKSGSSKKHLINFLMLGISGYMSNKEGITKTYNLLQSQLSPSYDGCLICRLHPDDIESIALCKQQDISIELGSDCVFENPKTNRKGFRIEFTATFSDSQYNIQKRELINLIKIQQIGDHELGDKYLFEGGGSLERVRALAAGIDDIFRIDKFAGLEDRFGLSKRTIDLLCALYHMKLSGYALGNKDQKQKSYRDIWAKMVVTCIQEKIVLSAETFGLRIQQIQNNMNKVLPQAMPQVSLDRQKELQYYQTLHTRHKNIMEKLNIAHNQYPTISTDNLIKIGIYYCHKLTDDQISILQLALQQFNINQQIDQEQYRRTLQWRKTKHLSGKTNEEEMRHLLTHCFHG